MSSLSVRLFPEPLRTLAFGAIGAGYMGVGTAFANPCRLIFIQNLTDALLMFSMDGMIDHFPLPSNGFLLLDISANRNNPQGALYISEGTRIYVKDTGVAPTMGAVYVTVFYGIN